MRRVAHAWLVGLAVAVAVAAAPAARAEDRLPARERLEEQAIVDVAIGVAPFERVAAPGASVPDLAGALADRLRAGGAQTVVGPEKLAAARSAATPDALQRVAADATLDGLVIGRVTGVGRHLSIDLRLRSGRTGGVAGTYVAEASSEADVEAALDRIAKEILADAPAAGGAKASRRVAPVARLQGAGRGEARRSEPRPVGRPAGSAAPARAEAEGSSAPAGELPFAFGRRGRGGPLAIRSDELDALQTGGARHLVFTSNVRVTQGDLALTSSRLEAFYPAGGSQPDRLEATGNVVFRQGGRQASCAHATYDRDSQTVVCRDRAEVRQGRDWLRGTELVLHLDEERLEMQGPTEARIAGKPAAGGQSPAPKPEGSPFDVGAGPRGDIAITAEEAEALQQDGQRQIVFRRNVRTTQGDVVLTSDQQEAVYPPGASQPDQMIATGNVRIEQPGRDVRCDRAVYRSAERVITCRGNAELRRGDDVASGEEIQFFLESEKLVVKGRADVRVKREKSDS